MFSQQFTKNNHFEEYLEIQPPSKFCPVCKLANEQKALVCVHCGAVLVDLQLEDNTTKSVENKRATDLAGSVGQELKSPSQGMAFFLFGKTEPFSIQNEELIYLGRLEKETSEAFVDLALLDGFNQGVSRRHAMIQRSDNRYEITDLHSSNGTFLNGVRLTPSKAYELKSGSIIQLGRLKMVAIFSWAAKR